MKGDKREETKVEKATLSFDLDRKLEVLKKYGQLEERTNVIRILPSCHYSCKILEQERTGHVLELEFFAKAHLIWQSCRWGLIRDPKSHYCNISPPPPKGEMERTVPFNAFPTSNRGGGGGEESTGGGAMKRRSIDGSDGGGDPRVAAEEEKNKKPRSDGGKAEVTAEEEEEEEVEEVNVAELGEDLILEVLKRADARTLGRAACVSRRWRRLAEDERLWEAVCTRDWVRVPYGERQLRSVVLALGGFRRLHSLYILPFLGTSGPRTAASSPALALPSVAATSPSPMTRRAHLQPRWGKDEVQLSLALLSIGFFEKMNPNNNHRGGGGGGCG